MPLRFRLSVLCGQKTLVLNIPFELANESGCFEKRFEAVWTYPGEELDHNNVAGILSKWIADGFPCDDKEVIRRRLRTMDAL